MSRYIGNYLRVPSLEPQQSSAPGIWSLSDQLAYQRANVWPPARDPYYNQTVLHLSGDVAATRETNPVTQPRTFLSDASSNNFLLTPNGDVSARPFSPYASSYSNYFTGSATYLTAGVASNWQFLNSGASDYTIEAWVYLYSVSSQQFICATNSAGAVVGMNFHISSGAALILDFTRGVGGSFATFTSTGTLTANAWNHVAVTFATSGKTASFYINGATAGSSSNTGYSYSASNPANTLNIGRDPSGTGLLTGYISNLRITNTLVYSGAFTPSAAPLTAVSGTSLLTCQSNRFRDASTNGYTITPSGSPAVSQNSPFVEYDTTSGSGYFDGSDYLIAPDNTAFDFSTPSGTTNDFTLEAWIYPVAFNTAAGIMGGYNDAAQTGYRLVLDSNGSLRVNIASFNLASAASTVSLNQWQHVVLTRTSNNVYIYHNGTQVASGTTSNAADAPSNFLIGRNTVDVNNWYFSGYISNVRVIKGTGVTSVTIPTAPLTPVSGTQLLTLQTRAPANNQGILDTSPNNFVVTRTGNVAQGSFSPFSPAGWSVYLDGTGDVLTIPDSAISQLGSSDFTIECWINTSKIGGSILTKGVDENVTWGNFYFSLTGSNYLFFEIDPTPSTSADRFSLTDTVAINNGQWYHVAVTRSGNDWKLFRNGTIAASGTSSASFPDDTYAWVVGGSRVSGSAVATWMGYISNLRLIKGSALYTNAFTPPTSPLSAITNTAFLICHTNRFIDASTNNFAITVTGDSKVAAFSPFAPTQAYVASQLGGSAYFDGSDYLDIPIANSSVFDISGAFTLECWFYYTSSSPGNSAIIGKGGGSSGWSTTSGNQWGLLTDSGSLYWMVNNGSGGNWSISTTTPASFAWHHVAISYNGTTTRVWLNGSSIGTNTSSYGLPTTRNMLRVGVLALTTPAYYHTGHISGLRFVQGQDLYNVNNTNIVIPTAPPLPTQNTSLLLNFTGAGIVDSTGKNVVETVGNSAVQTVQSRWPPGSMYFDGTGDYLVAPSSQFWTLGSTEDFTIEFWFYTSVTVPISGSTPSTLISNYPDWNTWTNRWAIATNDNKIKWYDHTGNPAIASNNFTYSVWNHVAVVRSSSSIKMYINGTQEGSTQTTNQTYTSTEKLYVGLVPSGAAFNGYIDDLRITKGYARYVAGTGGNAGQMVFNGTTTLAFPTINTRPFPLA